MNVQDVDNQEDNASSSTSSQDPSNLPVVPMSPQDRQALLSRAPADLAPALKAAADSIHNTADAQVWASLAGINVVHCSIALETKTCAATKLCKQSCGMTPVALLASCASCSQLLCQ